MKRIVILLLAVILAACGSPAAPTQPPAPAVIEPSATPVVIVQTVVVEATQAPTEIPPTAIPPTVAPVVVTVVVEPTQAPASGGDTSSAPIALDNTLGAGVFVNMTMSGSSFTLRCFPRDITFNVTANNPAVTDALFYYRIVDLQGLYPSEWTNAGEMDDMGNGNFTLVFTGENVHPNLRLDKAWFDFQFIGLNKTGTVVDRTQKIERLVTYSLDCP